MNEYKPPDDIWEVNRRLRIDEPLDGEKDPRWVDTGEARGEYSLHRLYRVLDVKSSGSALRLGDPPERGYYLFCGHRGCGKSTELRRICNDLHADEIYYVVSADAARELDVNNLGYQDILLHLASRLMEQLRTDRVDLDQVHLQRLEDWFVERVENQTQTKELALELKSGVDVEAGLPFLGKLFAGMSNAFKSNSTYKTVLRRTLQNHFTEFADAFGDLIRAAGNAVQVAGKGGRILFVVDGTDRLSRNDATEFFVQNVHQLQQVQGLFIYCAPIHLIYDNRDGAAVRLTFHGVFTLPMVKVTNADGSRNEVGFETMREILHRRAAPSLFDDGVADELIERSGGHPRDLLRLLQTAFMYAEQDRFDSDAARQAVRQVASEFRRFLMVEDYALLARVDADPTTHPHTPDTLPLLYNLALLEYNDFFWRSHPVIRTTDAYRDAWSRLTHGKKG